MALLLLFRMGHRGEKIKKRERERKEGGSEVNTEREGANENE